MLKFEKKEMVNDLLYKIKDNNLKFSPQFITNNLDLSLEDVIKILDGFVEDELLERVFAVKCDYCHYEQIYVNYEDIPFGSILECGIGHEFLVNNRNSYIWYRFTKEAKQRKKN